MKTGKAFCPSPFSQRAVKTRRKKLETEPDTKLHLPGVIALRTNYTPAPRICNIVGWIIERRMVEQVGDDELELGADTLDDLDVLRHSHVHVPIHQATDCSNAARPVVNTQNWVTNGIEHSLRISEHVQARPRRTILRANAIRTGDSVADRGAPSVRFRVDALFIAKEIGAIGRAERLAVGIREAIDRRPAPNGEDRG